MTIPEFYDLVRSMRIAQKSYFKERSIKWLNEARKLEKKVDLVLEHGCPINAPKPPTQLDLFSNQS